MQISLKELTERAAIFNFLKYGSTSNFEALHALCGFLPKRNYWILFYYHHLHHSQKYMCDLTSFFAGDSTSKVTSSWPLPFL